MTSKSKEKTMTSKSIEELVTAEEKARAEWEIKTQINLVGGGRASIAELRATFDSIHPEPRDGWKNSFAADVPVEKISIVRTAIEFFHGSSPIIGGMGHNDNPNEGPLVRITSRGYVG